MYIATTLLGAHDLVWDADPETGVPFQRERGYIYPGELVDIELSPERAEILLGLGYIAPAPEAPSEPPSPESSDNPQE